MGYIIIIPLIRSFIIKNNIHKQMDYDDAYQELSMVYLKCEKKYDESKGKFTTYFYTAMVNWWITYKKKLNKTISLDNNNEINNLIDNDKNIYNKIKEVLPYRKYNNSNDIFYDYVMGYKLIDLKSKYNISIKTIKRIIDYYKEELKNV